jgi:predicted nuclease of predicted toxin-antitoxin system
MTLKYYLHEGLSPKIAEILRRKGVDAVSAHEVGNLEISDQEQLEFAASQGRCMVTRNRDDFVQLTVDFFQAYRPHAGLLIIPYSMVASRFNVIADRLKAYANDHPQGLTPYSIDFLPAPWRELGR